MSENLQRIIDRVKTGNYTQEDILAIVSEISGGKLILASGSGSVAIGGDASNIQILTGSQNIIGDANTVIYIYGIDSEVIQSVVDRHLAIDKTFQRLFYPSSALLGIDWDWGIKLLQQQLPEIRKRLADTLVHNRVLMDISIEERQHWVNRSPLAADRILQIDGRNCGTLDANKTLIEILRRDDIEKKLLILGAPGAGKTTELVILAEQLVEGAISQPRTVIPVIFELSTWRDDNQSIQSWLIEQLYDLHPRNRKSKLYEKWLEHQVLLPLMDGLDELEFERQKKCTQKLNEFAEHYPHLVVCCRVKEFEAADIMLSNLRGAVCLKSLSDSQIQYYFESVQRPELWGEIQANRSLQAMLEPMTDGDPGLLRVPLFVKLLVDAYDPQQPISSKADLLDKYIDGQLLSNKREFDRRKELSKSNWAYTTVKLEPNGKKTCIFLNWIARNLRSNDKVEFLIERMQPDLLDSWLDKLIYALFIGLFFGSLGGIIIGFVIFANLCVISQNLSISGIVSLYVSVFFGFFFGLWAFIAIGYFARIDPVETLNLSKKNLFKSIVTAITIGFITWEILNVAYFSSYNTPYPIPSEVVLIIAVVFVVILEINGSKLQQTTRPNEGTWRSLENALRFAYVGGIVLVLCVFISKEKIHAFFPSLSFNPTTIPSFINTFVVYMSCILAGLFLGLTQAGTAFIQHFSLRIVLAKNGLPWNFVRFLNYCVERRLLLRVGGSYRFLHRELLDHFARSPNR
jgi:hypothetical protein